MRTPLLLFNLSTFSLIVPFIFCLSHSFAYFEVMKIFVHRFFQKLYYFCFQV